MNLFKRLFGKRAAQTVDVAAVAQKLNQNSDPLDMLQRAKSQISENGWVAVEEAKTFRSAAEFKIAIPASDVVGGVLDVIEGAAMDSATIAGPNCGGVIGTDNQSAYSVPASVANWYNSMGFIGYQMCAILAQHWLVDKACSQSVEDAVRNGWTYKPDAGEKLDDNFKSEIDDMDIEFKVKENLMEFGRFANIFGVRVMIFVVDSQDPDYYSKPFNEDGITKGSYKGMSQIDPYWMTPMLTNESMSNPASKDFYDPDYWVINGKRYHRSHLVIARGPQPADILKPTYIFGGIPMTQRIYERVYAAERTANEAPLLAMNKRTTAIHVDLDKVAADETSFMNRLWLWVKYRDNHAVKVLGKEEAMEQFDTSLADFDNVIMNQYQIVAATAKTPSTKLLGTSPKGFNATGEFETVSYHEELESIQERWMTPALNRHYLCLSKSLGLSYGLNITWEPVDSMSSEKQAEINSKKVTDAVNMITAGMISPDEGRDKIATDRDSGWNNISMNTDASIQIGASPENSVSQENVDVNRIRAEAYSDKVANSEGVPTEDHAVMDGESDEPLPPGMMAALGQMKRKLDDFIDEKSAARDDSGFRGNIESLRDVKPTVARTEPSVTGINSVVKSMDEKDMPKMRIGGVTVVVENPRNTIRQGNSISGPWQIKMPHHYGYVKNSFGNDGDEVDAFIGPNPKSTRVFIINQKDASTGEFDEHKVMLGFDSAAQAKKGYMQSFNKGWKGFDSMVEVSIQEFKNWINGSSEEQPLDSAVLQSTSTDGPTQG